MSNKKVVIFIFIIALISGFFWNSKMFGRDINNDQINYDLVAQNILYRNSFTLNDRPAFIEPVYPLFLVGVYYIFGHNFDAVRIIQIIIFALSVVIFFKLCILLVDKKIALYSSWAVAIFYGLASPAGVIGPSTLYIFIVLALVHCILTAEISKKIECWALAGIIAGLGALLVGSLEFIPVFIVANLLLVNWPTSLKIGLKNVIIFSLFFSLTLAPWSLRLAGHADSNFIAPKKGYLLLSKMEIAERVYSNAVGHFIGNFLGYYIAEKFYPSIDLLEAREAPDTEERFNKLEAEGISYYKIDEEFSGEAKDKIIKNPEKFAFGAILNFITLNSPLIPDRSDWQNEVYMHPMFTAGEHAGIPESFKSTVILGIRSVWWIFFSLIIYAIYDLFKNNFWLGWLKYGWIVLIILYFNIFYTLTHGLPRYALPIYAFYVILATVGLQTLWQKISLKLHLFRA